MATRENASASVHIENNSVKVKFISVKKWKYLHELDNWKGESRHD